MANLRIPHDSLVEPSDSSGNPLLRGIPDPRNDSDIVRLLAYDPFRDPGWRAVNRDPSRMLDHLRSVFVPTKKSLEIAEALYSCLRNGYARRDPRLPAVWSSFYQLENELPTNDVGPVYVNGMTISGITGLGKSHVVSRVLNTIPRTIRHTNFSSHLASLTQIVWLRVDMSTGAGIKALLLDILETIDRALVGKTEYTKHNSGSGIGIEKIINNTIRALKTHFCGMIVLDEIQRLNFGQKNASERVRNFLLKLLNTGIPVVLVGNPLGLTFEEKEGQSAQLSRRLQAHAKVRLDPADSPEDNDWRFIVQGLWRCQILPVITPLNEGTHRLLYELTGGFPDFLAALLASCQSLALKQGIDSISDELIREAARSNHILSEMRSLVEAFVLKDPLRLQRFSDIDRDYYRERWIQMRLLPKGSRAIQKQGGDTLKVSNNSEDTDSKAYNIVSKRRAAFNSEVSRRRKEENGAPGSSLAPLGEFYSERLKNLFESGNGGKDDL